MLMAVVTIHRSLQEETPWLAVCSAGARKRSYCNLPFQDSEADDRAALRTGTAAVAAGVVSSLGGKGGQPNNAEAGVDNRHEVRFGEPARPGPSRGANKVEPSWDREESLERWRVSSSFVPFE